MKTITVKVELQFDYFGDDDDSYGIALDEINLINNVIGMSELDSQPQIRLIEDGLIFTELQA